MGPTRESRLQAGRLPYDLLGRHGGGGGGGAGRASAPPAGPPAVRPPGAPRWEETAVAWLLDQCPPEFRGYSGLRRHPAVLARFAALPVAATPAGPRRGLGHAR